VGSSCNTKSSLGLDEFGGELIRGSARTDFLPWPEWRRDGAPGWWGTELDGNGGGGGPAQEIREWDGGSGVWALKERRGGVQPVLHEGLEAIVASDREVAPGGEVTPGLRGNRGGP
jgi:hypothetical protein